MDERIKIGIIYSYNEEWIGGTYYYLNLIESLNLLPDSQKPFLIILGNDKKSFADIERINYPYVSYKSIGSEVNLFAKIIHKSKRILFPKKNIQKAKINFGIDILFHPSETEIPNTIKKHLNWIPDFQEVYLPHLFSQEYLDFRKNSQQKLLSKSDHILFSSIDAQNDFRKLYPTAQSNCYVVNFCVFHSNYSSININDIKSKYQIATSLPYFFSPNQFWKHKNHRVILEAIKKIKKTSALNFQIVFSGKEFDHRNPTYFKEIRQFVVDNDLQNEVRFLGFIERNEQLCLMKNALAVIQPSLFEGWSTVVEDAKAMNQNIIVSSLNVHKEQLGNQAFYFDPRNEKELINQMSFFLKKNIEFPEFNYQTKQHQFGNEFMHVINKIIEK